VYEEIGAPDGQLISPTQVREVDNQGFEFLGFEGGTVINWIAFGVVEAEEDENGSDNGGTTQPEGMTISGPTVMPPQEENSWSTSQVPDTADAIDWTFGDGTAATGDSVTHAYSREGQYTIEAVAKSGTDTVDSDTLTVTVQSEDSGGNGGGDGGDEPPIEPPGILPIFNGLDGVSEE
jgi:hypothetical protein